MNASHTYIPYLKNSDLVYNAIAFRIPAVHKVISIHIHTAQLRKQKGRNRTGTGREDLHDLILLAHLRQCQRRLTNLERPLPLPLNTLVHGFDEGFHICALILERARVDQLA